MIYTYCESLEREKEKRRRKAGSILSVLKKVFDISSKWCKMTRKLIIHFIHKYCI